MRTDSSSSRSRCSSNHEDRTILDCQSPPAAANGAAERRIRTHGVRTPNRVARASVSARTTGSPSALQAGSSRSTTARRARFSPRAPSPIAPSSPRRLKLAMRSHPTRGAQSSQKRGTRCDTPSSTTVGGRPSTARAADRRPPTGSRRKTDAPDTLITAARSSDESRKNVCTRGP